MPRLQERYTAYLPKSNEGANRLADDIMRLAPRPTWGTLEDPETTGHYLRTVLGVDYVVRPFVDDAFDAQFTDPSRRSRFYLGIVVSRLDALKDPNNYPVGCNSVATAGVEGGDIDSRVLAWLQEEGEKAPKPHPMVRLRGDEAGAEVFDITAIRFNPLLASKAFLRGFYERWGIESLDRSQSLVLKDVTSAGGVREVMNVRELPLEVQGISKEELTALDTAPDLDDETWRLDLMHRTPELSTLPAAEDTRWYDSEGPDMATDLENQFNGDDYLAEGDMPPIADEYPNSDLDGERILETPVVEYTDHDGSELHQYELKLNPADDDAENPYSLFDQQLWERSLEDRTPPAEEEWRRNEF